jgi:biotin transport system permease protein
MTPALYVHRNTPIHRIPASLKVATLVTTGIGIFLVSDVLWLLPPLATILVLCLIARMPIGETIRQLRPAVVLIAVIFLVHGYFTSWSLGFLVVLRFAILLLLALLVTFTTRTSEMIDVLERGLSPLAVVGINPAKLSLMLSLALRFIPLLFEKFTEIREAQQARGLDGNIVALIMTLHMANDLTEAIEARGYDPDHTPAQRRGSRSETPTI